MEYIHTRLKNAREQAGLTLAQVAERTGYALTTLSGIENGHDQPSKRLLEKYIEALQLNDIWVKTGEGQVFQSSSFQRPITKEGDLAAPLRARIQKIRQHVADLLDELDKMEQELLESKTGNRSQKSR
jgi:transcriptional regulator with XRE-family HTH domain